MTTAPDRSPEEVLDFWFRDCRTDPKRAAEMNSVWFGGGEPLDDEIGRRFGPWIEAAAGGELDDWRGSARGRLALTLLLDQFPRNIHRGTAAAFAHDAVALTIAKELIDRGLFELSPPEQVFAILPLTHSEDLADQERALMIFDRCVDLCGQTWKPLLIKSRDFARDHHNVIARFGRFPHRNAVLGRPGTREEEAFLAEADTWGQ